MVCCTSSRPSGVREDVTDIILNIMDVAIKMVVGDGPKRLVAKKSGPRRACGG